MILTNRQDVCLPSPAFGIWSTRSFEPERNSTANRDFLRACLASALRRIVPEVDTQSKNHLRGRCPRHVRPEQRCLRFPIAISASSENTQGG